VISLAVAAAGWVGSVHPEITPPSNFHHLRDTTVRAMFDGNRTLDHSTDSLRRTMGEALVEGRQGTISLLGDGSVWLRKFHAQSATMLLQADTWDGFSGDCVHALQSHVGSGILRGTELENTTRDYLDVVTIENAIYTSSEAGRKIELGTA
jgi:hypothetical protein